MLQATVSALDLFLEYLAYQMDTTLGTEVAWRACSQGKFYDRKEGAVVYYDSASGNTVLITDFAADVLRSITQSPMSLEALLNLHPGTTAGGIEEADLHAATQRVLDDLAANHLIEKI